MPTPAFAQRAVICHSGGIDSTVLLYDLRAQGYDVIGFGVDYGQRHVRELVVARAICGELGVPYMTATIATPLVNSDLIDGRGGPVVPNRNMMLIALAGACAVSYGADHVAVATHAGDGPVFPDCRPRFLDAVSEALMQATNRQVRLLRPYVHLSKIDVISKGIELGVPLADTWSCYTGGPEPCGECLACRERREALFLSGVVPA